MYQATSVIFAPPMSRKRPSTDTAVPPSVASPPPRGASVRRSVGRGQAAIESKSDAPITLTEEDRVYLAGNLDTNGKVYEMSLDKLVTKPEADRMREHLFLIISSFQVLKVTWETSVRCKRQAWLPWQSPSRLTASP